MRELKTFSQHTTFIITKCIVYGQQCAHTLSLINTWKPQFGLSVIPRLYHSHLLTAASPSTPHLTGSL